jgi:hypothetical protein
MKTKTEQSNSAQSEWEIRATDEKKEQLWSLVRRIKESYPLNKAPRSRVLFEYLCAHALNHPDVPLGEQQIGIEVFGREPGYSNEDTIVRVQVSQLRRRLKEYFLAAGEDEPITIEISPGHYIPRFLQRETKLMLARDEVIPAVIEQPMVHSLRPRRRRWVIVASLVMAFALGAGLATAWYAVHRQAAPASVAQPCVKAFWSQFFANGETAEIVPPDLGALVAANIAEHGIDMKDYVGRIYTDEILAPVMRSPKAQAYVSGGLERGAISIDQLGLLEELWTTLTRLGYSATTVSPRGFDIRTPLARNLILVGHSRAIPGEAPLTDTLNFQFRYDDKQRHGMIVNVVPRPGEQPLYVYGSARGPSYAVLAFARSTTSQNNVLVLYGANMGSTSGALDFVTKEPELERLYQLLHVRPGDSLPSFEVLLESEPGATGYQIIASRTHPHS